jgi:hypothetical protein
MTKNLLILTIIFFLGVNVSAQCVPDNSITKPGFYPATLPAAELSQTYNQVIHFKIVKDTTVILFGNPTAATIDSATVTKVTGMPPGITFDLNKKSKTYTPAEVGCAAVTGIPTSAGTFKINIVLLIYAKISGFKVSQADTIKNFSIVVNGSAGQTVLDKQTFTVYPNPLNGDVLNLKGLPTNGVTNVEVINATGQLIDKVKLEAGQSTLPFNYPTGLYNVRFINAGQQVSVKMLKQ